MENQGTALQVDTAVQAVLAALDWKSSPDSRQHATAYLESVRFLDHGVVDCLSMIRKS